MCNGNNCDPVALLEFLNNCPVVPQGPIGTAPHSWATDVGGQQIADGLGLSRQRLSRADLCTLRDKGASPEKLFMSIMAWGGMKRDHGRLAWAQGPRGIWSERVTAILTGQLTRFQAYELFANGDPIPGMGPAYYTKLIQFCQGGDNPFGYIMDQWTAKSINLLTGVSMVVVNSANRVVPTNDANVYEHFCAAIDTFALEIGVDGHEFEKRILSYGAQGRRPRGPWRQRVVDCWQAG